MNESELLKMETTNEERAVAEGRKEVRMWEDTEEELRWEDRKRWRDIVARHTTNKESSKEEGNMMMIISVMTPYFK